MTAPASDSPVTGQVAIQNDATGIQSPVREQRTLTNNGTVVTSPSNAPDSPLLAPVAQNTINDANQPRVNINEPLQNNHRFSTPRKPPKPLPKPETPKTRQEKREVVAAAVARREDTENQVTEISTQIQTGEQQFVKDLERMQRYADRCKKSGNDLIKDFGLRLREEVIPLVALAKAFEADLNQALEEPNAGAKGKAVAAAYTKHQDYFTKLKEFSLVQSEFNSELKDLEARYPYAIHNVNQLILGKKRTIGEAFLDKEKLTTTFEALSMKCTERGPEHQEMLNTVGGHLANLNPADGLQIHAQVRFMGITNQEIQDAKNQASTNEKAEIMKTLSEGRPSSGLMNGMQKYVSKTALDYYKEARPDDNDQAKIDLLSLGMTTAHDHVKVAIANLITGEADSGKRSKIRQGLAQTAIKLAQNGDLASANLIIDNLEIDPKENDELQILNNYQKDLDKIKKTKNGLSKAKAYAKSRRIKSYLTPLELINEMSVVNNTVKYLTANAHYSAVDVF